MSWVDAVVAYLLDKNAPPDAFDGLLLIGLATVAVVIWTGILLLQQIKHTTEQRRIQRRIAEWQKVRQGEANRTVLQQMVFFDGGIASAEEYIKRALFLPLAAGFVPELYWRPILLLYIGRVLYGQLVLSRWCFRFSGRTEMGKRFVHELYRYLRWETLCAALLFLVVLWSYKEAAALVTLVLLVICIKLVSQYPYVEPLPPN